MDNRHEGKVAVLGELPDDDSIEWTITRALLSASDSTSRALESHLMQTQYHDYDCDERSTEQTRAHIDDAIDRHEQILEDLRFARDALEYR
ncbi:hypothetical protein C440_16911 [Haloferax mucosum ATCC BAA-1512]|uniref:DUF8103 domain-containing protein n=2 Tax=Haloferax mucosum TaxID=403181 RepID=M0I4R8_9EURY|nr:hypothetical protein C440_16911 [Haloferax mucosum ATCC BAA-1512]